MKPKNASFSGHLVKLVLCVRSINQVDTELENYQTSILLKALDFNLLKLIAKS